ncbi:hypothetical protein AMAG_19171 [Allomyces macrogynus ATCC 38327]|uniref:Endonuclease/exonuclease/phosphatase domain-containing protein n=1 Tax=Allomyces macrogynus (strain ATCC 38327) TaxID=578462 RepID=A0A0L0SPQ2_ALLM3|nr:hypothetical protein AMAG_19171 [Allomyces macrogynus ATCC 38327]|eukprot:KNE64493.1 hypothetical protein AMAG_19171 [Allomyces macrogynus ATCC 38327]
MMASTDGTAGTPPPKYRFLVHRIVNKLPVPLVLTGDMHASGRWWTTPPLDVAPHSDADYSSCNSDTALQVLPGTSGAVTYKVENTDLVVALFFSNPTIGSYKAGARVYRSHVGCVPLAQLRTDYAVPDVLSAKDAVTIFDGVTVRSSPATAEKPVEFTITLTQGYTIEPVVGRPSSSLASHRGPLARAMHDGESATTLRLLSYNMFLRPFMVANPRTFASNDYKESRTELFTRLAPEHYDVMCLQEVFDPALRDSIKSMAHRFDYSYCVDGPTTSLGLTSGLLVLSKFPILESHKHLFYHGASTTDPLATKGLLAIKLQLPHGDPLTVVSVHLQGGANKDAARLTSEAASTRFSQLLEVAAFLRDRPHLLQSGVVLAGDLNLVAGSDEYHRALRLLHSVVPGRDAVVADLALDAGMTAGTWRPWAQVAAPSNPVDSALGYLVRRKSDELHARDMPLASAEGQGSAAAAPVDAVRLDYLIYLRAAVEGIVPQFKVAVNKFSTEHEEQDYPFTQLSDHDALCLYL